MKLKITQEGIELMLRATDGTDIITLCGMVLGNGEYTGDVGEKMQNPLLSLSLSDKKLTENCLELTSVFNNSTVHDRFRVTEIGILAKNPENTEDTILFAYGYVPGAEAAVIPSINDYIFETEFTVSIFIGSFDNINVSLEEKMIGVSKEDFANHVNNKNNPHNVTKEALGLDKVENRAFDEHTPTYIISEELEEAKPGEKVGSLLGKIAKGLKELIAHLGNSENPHKITARQIGAASSTHLHSAADINSGVLSAERGGTGVTNTEDFADKYAPVLTKAGMARIEVHTYTGTGTYGKKNPTKITFNNKPTIVIMIENNGDNDTGRQLFYYGETYISRRNHSGFGWGCNITWEENKNSEGNIISYTLKLWKEIEGGTQTGDYIRGQWNVPGTKYTCIAIC